MRRFSLVKMTKRATQVTDTEKSINNGLEKPLNKKILYISNS